MNNKAAIGLVAAIIILVGAFFVFNKPVSTPVVLTQTASTTAATPHITPLSAIPTTVTPGSTGPHMEIQTKPVVHHVITVDTATLTSSAPRPIITGTATNVGAIGIVLDNPAGVGIEGASNILVVKGRWSFVPAQALTPGTYTLHLVGADAPLSTKLVITAP